MQTVKTMGHTTTKFNRKESLMIIQSFREKDAVFDARLSQDPSGFFVEVLYNRPAVLQVKSLAGVFGNEQRIISKPINNLDGIHVRLSVIDGSVAMYIGASLLVALGFTREERGGVAKIAVDILPEGLKIYHFKKELQDMSPLSPANPITAVEESQVHPMDIFSSIPRNETETQGWLILLMARKPNSFPFNIIERAYPKAFPDLDVVMKNGTKAKAEIEFTADKWDVGHTEQMKRGTHCDFAIVWDMGQRARSSGQAFSEAVRMGMKVLVLKEIAQI